MSTYLGARLRTLNHILLCKATRLKHPLRDALEIKVPTQTRNCPIHPATAVNRLASSIVIVVIVKEIEDV